MRILHLTPYYAPAYAFGGVVRSAEGMTRALARRGHTVTVLTTDALDQQSRYDGVLDSVEGGVQVVRVPNLLPTVRGRYNLSTPQKMAKRAAELLPDVDVVHCHEFRTVENLLVTPLAARLGKPLVLSPHGTLAQETGRGGLKRLWDRTLSSAVALRFGQVVALSQAELADIEALWPMFGRRRVPTTFSIIPNGVDPADYADLSGRGAFRAKYQLGDAPVCLFMARLHPRKGVGLLVEAFKAAGLPDARLVIAGPDEGMLDTLRPMLDARIVVTGYLGGADRLAAFAAADVLALPAVGEGLPMVVLEAMAAGLPVIVSPGCNLPEVVQHGAGLEVEAVVEPLSGALRSLLPDAARRARMGAAARALVNERFTWDAVAAQLEGLYEK
ncbi:MAG: glycosyltransferase [Chloroflexi bacterium]|nr:glycosyltransferase [Chloroflexota bacterium]MCC6896188.1 glycosyltransferase [Anaerolineae bacterium]